MTDARTITEVLGGNWFGSYGLAFCPAHANLRTPALSLREGSDGRLLAYCHAGCDFSSVLDALRGMGVIRGTGSIPRVDPAELARREAVERREADKRARQAQRCWAEAQPIGGTIAETYLREARGITCALPDTIRFHPNCWHGATARRIPVMVGLVQGVHHFAVHRTWLRPDGSGKAEVDRPKDMLGKVKGGAVRVSKGQHSLAVAEGIETALSLKCGFLDRDVAVWCALSTTGMKALRLPDGDPGSLTIATDGDERGRDAGHHLARHAAAIGWAVSLFPAPEGRDWNDELLVRKWATKWSRK